MLSTAPPEFWRMTGRRDDMEKRVLQQAVSGIVLFFLSASVASGATYYVRTDGNNANTGTANTAAGAWRTIDWAADHASAGDVLRVQAGIYVEVASPGVSGTAGNTVTLVADGAVATCGMSFSNRNYIRVIGFTIDGNSNGCANSTLVSITGINTGLEFWNNALADATQGYRGGGQLSDRCNACIFLGGTIDNIGNSGVGLTVLGNDTFVGYIDFDTICYLGVNQAGNRLRFVNLNFIRLNPCNATHPDFFYIHGLSSLGYSNSLVESIFGIGTPTSSHNKSFHAQNEQPIPWNDNIWRSNVVDDMGSAFFSMYTNSGQGASNRWRFYNNTLVDCSQALSATGVCGNIASAGSTYIYNTLFSQAWSNDVTSNISVWASSGGTVTFNYNAADDPDGPVTFSAGWNNQANEQSNVDPGFVNRANRDFTLQSGSGMRGVGGPLTTANGSGSSSTSLTVAANTGSFFIGSNAGNLPQYGGNLVPGDFITVGSTTVQVSSVSGDTLTLASPISWTNGAPVYFGSSSTIDIGAYPYKPGGYTLSASYAISGGTATVMPNDPSLARFVVCYSDSVPYAIDNSSPYTCAAPAGTFSARVYPRYPSQTLWVTAGSSGALPPSTPTGLNIQK